MRFGRRIFAIIILAISAVGLVAYAYSIALQNNPPGGTNSCAPPSTASNSYNANFQGNEYKSENVSFTDINQQVALAGVVFTVASISDPSIPQPQNGNCVSVQNSNVQATIQVRATFNDASSETLTLNYKGGLTYETNKLSTHQHPTAGLLWQPGKSYIILLVSLS